MGHLPERPESALRTLPELFGDERAASADVVAASQAAGLQAVDGGECPFLHYGDMRSWAGGCSSALFDAVWIALGFAGLILYFGAIIEKNGTAWGDWFGTGLMAIVIAVGGAFVKEGLLSVSSKVSLVLSVRDGDLSVHHEDCWAYNGGCTVYACRGRPVG